MLVDSHCHLDFSDYAHDLDDVLARAKQAGVGHMLTICTDMRKALQVIAIAEQYPHIYCSVGVHPHDVEIEPKVTIEGLKTLAQHRRVVGLGETGLDFYYDNSPRDTQEWSFRTHIEAARETQLPIVIHTRDADEATARILDEEMKKGVFSGVIHCFTGSEPLARKVLDLGLYISFSGILTFKNAHGIRDVARFVPLDRLLVETDAPYLAPVPARGKRNEPAYVVHTAAQLAAIKSISAEYLAEVTTNNFFRLFSKAMLGDWCPGG